MSMPPWTLATSCVRAACGIAEFSLTRSVKPVASALSRTAPMIAVPSDEPRFCAVPWSPPASLVCVGETADMITLPSWEASRPAPAPVSASASLKPVSLSVTSSVASITIAPMQTATSPARATARGERRAAIRGPRSAKMSIATDRGRRRLPVSNTSSPSTTCRYTGITKKVPIRTSCWPMSVPRAGAQRPDPQQRGVEQRVLPLRARRCSHEPNAHRSASPPSTMNGTTEKPSGVISVPPMVSGVRDFTKPQTLARRIASTMMPSPAEDSTTPTMSSRGTRSAAGARAICPRSRRITITTTVSAAKT